MIDIYVLTWEGILYYATILYLSLVRCRLCDMVLGYLYMFLWTYNNIIQLFSQLYSWFFLCLFSPTLWKLEKVDGLIVVLKDLDSAFCNSVLWTARNRKSTFFRHSCIFFFYLFRFCFVCLCCSSHYKWSSGYTVIPCL